MLKEKIKLLERDLGEVAVEPVHDEEKPVELTPEVENEDTYPVDDHKETEEVKAVLVEDIEFLDESFTLFEKFDNLSDEDFKELLEELTYEEIEILESLYTVFSGNEILTEGFLDTFFRGKNYTNLKQSREEDIATAKENMKNKISSYKNARKQLARNQRGRNGTIQARKKELKDQSKQKIKDAKLLKRNDGEDDATFRKRRIDAILAASQIGSEAKKTAKMEAKEKLKEFKRKTKEAIAKEREAYKTLKSGIESDYKTAMDKDRSENSVAGKVVSGAKRVGGWIGSGVQKIGARIHDARQKAAEKRAERQANDNENLKTVQDKFAQAALDTKFLSGVNASFEYDPELQYILENLNSFELTSLIEELEAEEVKETLVESLNSLSRTEMISFLESLQPREWKLLIKENWFTDILKKFGKKARERKRAKKILEQHAEEASVETDIDIYSLDIIEILSGLGVKTMGTLTDVQKNAFMNFLQTLIEEEAEAFVPVEVDSGVTITKIPTEEVK